MELFRRQHVKGRHGFRGHLNRCCYLVSDAVAGEHNARMAVNVDVSSMRKDLSHPTGVIIMPVTQREDIGLTQIDAKGAGVG